MVEKEVREYFEKNHPGKNIISLPPDNPSEIICEIEPTTEHPNWSSAIAAIDQSIPHKHKKSIEIYRVLKGSLNLYINDTLYTLKEGDLFTIPQNQIHWAQGDTTFVKINSYPGWSKKDHILKRA